MSLILYYIISIEVWKKYYFIKYIIQRKYATRFASHLHAIDQEHPYGLWEPSLGDPS